MASKHHIARIRTRRRALWTNSVVERFFEAIKYEHLYRRDIASGPELADQVATYRAIYNTIRPHEAIAMRRPLQRYRQTPNLSQILDTHTWGVFPAGGGSDPPRTPRLVYTAEAVAAPVEGRLQSDVNPRIAAGDGAEAGGLHVWPHHPAQAGPISDTAG